MTSTPAAGDPPLHEQAPAGSPPLKWLRLLLAVVVLATFAPLCTADFTNWDDPATIWDNPRLNPPTLDNMLYYWTHANMDLYAPVTYTVWAILAWIAQVPTPDALGIRLNPWIFHTANVLLHLGSALAAFELLRRLVSRPSAALAGALLFAVHPVQVESVGWVSGLKDVLWGLFSLLALWQYVLFVQAEVASDQWAVASKKSKRRREASTNGTRWGHYAVALVCLGLALLSKPSAMVTPLIAFLIDYFLLRRRFVAAVRALWPWFLLALLVAIHATRVQPGSQLSPWPIWNRPLIAADALAFYLYKLIWPIHLIPDYGRTPAVLLHSTWKYWTWLIPLAVAGVLWGLARKIPWLIAGSLIFVAGVLPVLGLMPFDFQQFSTVADHYLYLALLGPALALAFVLSRAPTRWLGAATALILIALTGRSMAQTQYWQNTPALFEHTLALNPRSAAAHERLGAYDHRQANQLVKMAAAEPGTPAAAQAHNAAQVLFEKAVDQYNATLLLKPDWPVVHLNLARALSHLKRWDEAMAHLKTIIALQPHLPPALRGGFETQWFNQGVTAYERGDYRQAVADFRRSLAVQPDNDVSKVALPIAGNRMIESGKE